MFNLSYLRCVCTECTVSYTGSQSTVSAIPENAESHIADILHHIFPRVFQLKVIRD